MHLPRTYTFCTDPQRIYQASRLLNELKGSGKRRAEALSLLKEIFGVSGLPENYHAIRCVFENLVQASFYTTVIRERGLSVGTTVSYSGRLGVITVLARLKVEFQDGKHPLSQIVVPTMAKRTELH